MDGIDAYEARRHVGHKLAVVVEGESDDTVTLIVCQTCDSPVSATTDLAPDPMRSGIRARVTPYTRADDGTSVEVVPPYPDAVSEWNLSTWTEDRMNGLCPDVPEDLTKITLAINTDAFMPRWTTQWFRDGGLIEMEVEANYAVEIRGVDATGTVFSHKRVVQAWDEHDARDLWESNEGEVFTAKGYAWKVSKVYAISYPEADD